VRGAGRGKNEETKTVYFSKVMDVSELDCSKIARRVHNEGKQGGKGKEDYDKREDQYMDECAIASFKAQLKKKDKDYAGFRSFFVRRELMNPQRNQKCISGGEVECYLTKEMAEKNLADNIGNLTADKWKILRK
jgi:hypothetical protein